MFGVVFERMGLTGESAAKALHSYATFMIGGVLFAATRRAANEQLASTTARTEPGPFHTEGSPAVTRRSTKRTRLAIDRVMEVSVTDPGRDEELFIEGLRRLVGGLRP
jgi:hypothetical protein